MEEFNHIVVVIETLLFVVLGATSFRYYQISNKTMVKSIFVIWFGLGITSKWNMGHLYTVLRSIGDTLSRTPSKHDVKMPSALYVALPYILIFMTLIVLLVHFVMLSNMKALKKEFLLRTLHTTRKVL